MLLDTRDHGQNINLLPVFRENFVPTNSEYIVLIGLPTAIPMMLHSICNADVSILWLVGKFSSNLSSKLLGQISRNLAISGILAWLCY